MDTGVTAATSNYVHVLGAAPRAAFSILLPIHAMHGTAMLLPSALYLGPSGHSEGGFPRQGMAVKRSGNPCRQASTSRRCWQDHNAAGRSATRRQLQVSMGLRARSSVVSTSLMVDTFLCHLFETYSVPLIARFAVPAIEIL